MRPLCLQHNSKWTFLLITATNRLRPRQKRWCWTHLHSLQQPRPMRSKRQRASWEKNLNSNNSWCCSSNGISKRWNETRAAMNRHHHRITRVLEGISRLGNTPKRKLSSSHPTHPVRCHHSIHSNSQPFNNPFKPRAVAWSAQTTVIPTRFLRHRPRVHSRHRSRLSDQSLWQNPLRSSQPSASWLNPCLIPSYPSVYLKKNSSIVISREGIHLLHFLSFLFLFLD